MQQFPDFGAVHFVPRDGVNRAVGGVKLVQQVLAAENTLLRGACEVAGSQLLPSSCTSSTEQRDI